VPPKLHVRSPIQSGAADRFSRLIRKEMGKRRFAEATESSSNMRTETMPIPSRSRQFLLSSFSRCSYLYRDNSNIGGAAQGGGPLIYPLTITSITTETQWPYVQQYHLDIQRELARNTLLTVAYVGSKGTHLSRQLDGNQDSFHPRQSEPIFAGANHLRPRL